MASEGLLLIRLEADERGRYGFNVKVSGNANENSGTCREWERPDFVLVHWTLRLGSLYVALPRCHVPLT